MVDDEARWAQLVARDPAGTFWYSVATTGVYCRPGCASRRPRRENVAFYDSPGSARAAGFRACARCQPDGPDPARARRDAVVAACRRLDAGDDVDLDEVAAAMGLSRGRFGRLFREVVGLPPGQYARARQARRLEGALRREGSVTDAAFAAGFSSSGRFYETAGEELGMAPMTWKRGGEGICLRRASSPCALGVVAIAASDRGLCAILLGDDEPSLFADLAARFPRAGWAEPDEDLSRHLAQVVALIGAPAGATDLPLDVQGTAFQRRVWAALRQIPAGQTRTYAQLAAQLGEPSATRAVAGACAANPAAVLVPCHRVVRSDGGLSGYRWGVSRKADLLRSEGALPEEALPGLTPRGRRS